MSKGNRKPRRINVRHKSRNAGEIRFRVSDDEHARALANMQADKFTDINAWSRWKLCQP